jgi:hypothetical protein
MAQYHRVSVVEREALSRMLAAGASLQAIGQPRLDPCEVCSLASTICLPARHLCPSRFIPIASRGLERRCKCVRR